MYTVVKLFTVLTRNMGQKNKTWENTVDPDKTAPLRMGSLCHYTRKIVAMIRIIGYVVPVFKIITAVIEIIYRIDPKYGTKK